MSSILNRLSTKMTIVLNTSTGSETSTGNVIISGLDPAITAAKVAAVETAVTPLFEYPITETKVTTVSLLADDGE